jgi:CheY-like chemotaxis protein
MEGMQLAPDAHILVVEDDPDTRDSLCEALIDAGYLPFAVGDGVEALEHLRTGARPTLIILDLMLPRIDGWRFLSIVAEAPELSSIPVVVCSGALEGARPPGVPRDHILPKPVDLDHLMAFVARYCGTRDHAPWSTPTTPGKRKKRTTPSKRGRERV